jgi:hypothetical protein
MILAFGVDESALHQEAAHRLTQCKEQSQTLRSRRKVMRQSLASQSGCTCLLEMKNQNGAQAAGIFPGLVGYPGWVITPS